MSRSRQGAGKIVGNFEASVHLLRRAKDGETRVSVDEAKRQYREARERLVAIVMEAPDERR